MAEDAEDSSESPLEEVEEGGFTSILRYVILAILVAFIAAVGFALILGIPLIQKLLPHAAGPQHAGPLRALSVPAGTLQAMDATDPVSQILNAIISGIVMVINAIFQGIVAVFGTISSVIAAVITAIIMAPINFFSASWNAATATLAGFGIGAPVAMIFVIIAVFAVLGIGGFLLVNGLREVASVAEG